MADVGVFRWMGESVIVEVKSNRLGFPRLGITVTKRYGKAHARNRFKRLVREAFRMLDWTDFQTLDVLVKPKKNANLAEVGQIQEDLLLASKRFLLASNKKNNC